MTNNPQLPPLSERASTLSVLVNHDRIRSSIKRMFRNRIDESLAELFQNSQRSGSTAVDITTSDDGFTVQDNGHGLLNGIDGFHTLLKLAESHFDNETIEDQDPMGVGIVSLLTHDQITEVTFRRAGIIEDAAYNELLAFIKSEIFAFIFNPKNRSRIKAAHVEACYKLDAAYSLANCPYIVAESIQTSENPNSLEDFNSTSEFDFNNRSINEIFSYDKLPLLLNEQVSVQLASGATDAEHGLRSFLPETGPAYILRQGDENRVSIGTLWWKPEGEPQHDWFYQPGQYGVSYDDTPPEESLQITKGPVFTFNDPNSYDAGEVDFIVGTAASPIEFLHKQVWAGFSPDDERDYDPQQESYQNSIDDLIRSIIGNCVPRDFTLYQISRFFKDPTAPIISITYRYKIGGKFVNPRRVYKPEAKHSGTLSPAEITVKSATGEKVRLKLY